MNMINSSNSEPSGRHRPGPFGPAHLLLPKDQELLVLDGETLANNAIERMIDKGYSQLPVTNAKGHVIGVFTWKSLSKRVADFASANVNCIELPIKELMEPARFISPDVYIDTETDWGDIDHVLIGTPEDLMGVLCVSDVFGRLNDFAEAFVLLYEIEHEIRDLIGMVYPGEQLKAALDGVSDSANRPKARVVDGLKHHLKEHGGSQEIGNAIRFISERPSQRIESLKDLTFAQYRSIIFSHANWEQFQVVFASIREVVDAEFENINKIRNVVFHFKRAITPSDTDRLRRFRDRLRYNQDMYRDSVTSDE